jgi:tetratricopeptide (TPR) repeat protein
VVAGSLPIGVDNAVAALLKAASDACHAAPDHAESHYKYGEAWLAAGEPARAEQAFATALRLAPSSADAWVNFGIARYRQGAVEDAKAAMRQALIRQPGHAAAIANLGAFLRITGAGEAAEALLRATVAAAPNNIGARLNLAADLLSEERSSEALALLDAADAPADPQALRYWHLHRSLALLQLGQADAASACLDGFARIGPIPPALLPHFHWRQVLLALCRGDQTGAKRAAIEKEAALETMGPDAVLEHRIMARYDLAKFWSARGEHRRAFAHWTEGHTLLRIMQPFSREDHRAIIDANIAHFTRDRFRAGLRASNVDPAPVFIVGMPRSGTTLCEQILAAHTQVHGAGERVALGQAYARLGGHGVSAPQLLSSFGQPALDAAASAYLGELHALAPSKTRVVDKMPGNYLYLGLVGLMLPGARIIHCVRDPRDIGLSIYTFRFHGAHGYAHDLGDLGWTIAQQDRLMAHWRTVLPNPILAVRLSDWVEDFDATLSRVLDHLDLPPDPNCARFYERDSRVRTVSRAQVRQPVHAGGLGRWSTYALELAPLIAELDSAGMLAAFEPRKA